MLIEKTTTETVKQTVELNLPAYYKHSEDDFYKICEGGIVNVTSRIITARPTSFLFQSDVESIVSKGTEINEKDFNSALDRTLTSINLIAERQTA